MERIAKKPPAALANRPAPGPPAALPFVKAQFEGQLLRVERPGDPAMVVKVQSVDDAGVHLTDAKGVTRFPPYPLDFFAKPVDQIRVPYPGQPVSTALCTVAFEGPAPAMERVPSTLRNTRWSTAFLESKRQVADPLADEAVKALSDAQLRGLSGRLMTRLAQGDDALYAEYPAPVRDYLTQASALPAWADAEKIRLGKSLFQKHQAHVVMILGCAALPTLYATPGVAKVLGTTDRLNTHTLQRLTETMDFVRDVMEPGELKPGSDGVRATQRIRLMHAVVRHQINKSPQAGNTGIQGKPINQEDLAATLMTFSWVVVASMMQLGQQVSPQEAEAYLHTWKVVGSLMGIDADLLPDNMADAMALMHALAQHQQAPTPEGKELTRNLVGSMGSTMPLHALHFMPTAAANHLLGKDVGHNAGLEQHGALAFLGNVLNRTTDAVTARSPAIRAIRDKLLQGVVNATFRAGDETRTNQVHAPEPGDDPKASRSGLGVCPFL